MGEFKVRLRPAPPLHKTHHRPRPFPPNAQYMALFKCVRLLRLGRIVKYLERFDGFANAWRIFRFCICVAALCNAFL